MDGLSEKMEKYNTFVDCAVCGKHWFLLREVDDFTYDPNRKIGFCAGCVQKLDPLKLVTQAAVVAYALEQRDLSFIDV